ncbi:hypothetical protein [Arthrobacter sp. NicSoilC12]|uniref:hypothetical protein n=1 Tax=Arthrobacter sp. NicSoilC12 TaxID=2831001 RepID=UPI001CC72442|nr:hypothetical protein [Arthrobacter sp. NicSoilC12]
MALFSFAGLFSWFYQISAPPKEVNLQESILVYADRPSVPMRVSASFEDLSTGYTDTNSVFLSLIVDSSYQGDSVGFSVVFRGEQFRRQGPKFADNIGDCTLDVVIYDEVTPSCKDARNLKDVTEFGGLNESQVLSGTITRNNDVFVTGLTVFADEGWSSVGAKRTAFSLPEVGTNYREPSWGPSGESVGDQRLFDPDMAKLTLTYRALRGDEKVEIISPAPSEEGRLYWQRTGSGSIKAYGSTVQLGMEDRQSNETFLIGVLAGLVPLIVGWFYKQLGQLVIPTSRQNRGAFRGRSK